MFCLAARFIPQGVHALLDFPYRGVVVLLCVVAGFAECAVDVADAPQTVGVIAERALLLPGFLLRATEQQVAGGSGFGNLSTSLRIEEGEAGAQPSGDVALGDLMAASRAALRVLFSTLCRGMTSGAAALHGGGMQRIERILPFFLDLRFPLFLHFAQCIFRRLSLALLLLHDRLLPGCETPGVVFLLPLRRFPFLFFHGFLHALQTRLFPGFALLPRFLFPLQSLALLRGGTPLGIAGGFSLVVWGHPGIVPYSRPRRLPMRTRFAPSPTGSLHVGGLRTALFAWLLARQTDGQFLLRIEDTDQERFVPGAVEEILRMLDWAGLTPDEGVVFDGGQVAQKGNRGPYIQSQRADLYREHAEKLIASGHAYYAFDTKDAIDTMRAAQQAAGNPAPKYDWSVRQTMTNSLTLPEEDVRRRLDAGEPFVIRFKTPTDRIIVANDAIRGRVEFSTKTLDDQVLLKSDGHATYHLAHPIDDHLMGIDIVIRGEEWLPSLPKHLLLFEALGWEAPQFAHVSLLLNADRTKLSKRTGSVSAEAYVAKGYLPEALLNFLVLLGWNPGTTQEVFTREELVAQFSLDRVQKAGAIFDTTKLDWLQGQWMRRIAAEDFANRIRPLVMERFPAAAADPAFVNRAHLIQDRITFFHEAPDMLAFFYETPAVPAELLANAKQKVTPEVLPALLEGLTTMLQDIGDNDWTDERILAESRATAEARGWKLGQLLWPLRAALTGKPFSPGAVEVACALGKEETLRRLTTARTQSAA